MKEKKNYSEFGLPSFFLLVSIWYLIDAYKAESSIENLLLILPAAAVVICLCLWLLVSQFFIGQKSTEALEEVGEVEEKKDQEPKDEVSVLGAMIILAGYVLTMNWIGFDVATFGFIASLMFLQGERRPAMLIGFSLIFSFLVSLFFEYMIPYPMPMLLGKEFLGGLL